MGGGLLVIISAVPLTMHRQGMDYILNSEGLSVSPNNPQCNIAFWES